MGNGSVDNEYFSILKEYNYGISSLNGEEIISFTCEFIRKKGDCSDVFIFPYDSKKELFFQTKKENEWSEFGFKYLNQLNKEERFVPKCRENVNSDDKICSDFFIPLTIGNRYLGALYCFSTKGLNKNTKSFMLILSQSISSALYNAELSQSIKDKEIKIIETDKIYTSLVQTSNNAILRIDKDGVIRYINDFGLNFFEYSAEEIIGKHVTETIVPETDSEGRNLREMVRHAFSNPEKFVNNDNENITKSGKHVWVSWANKPIYNQKGEFIEILSIGNDITSIKNQERKLRESETKYREMVEGMNESICKFNVKNVEYEYLSPSTEKLMGYPISKFFENPMFLLEIVHPEHQETITKYFENLFKGIIEKTMEFKIILPDGSIKWILQSLKGTYDDAGNVMYVEGVGRDITTNKYAEQQLIKSEKVLKEAQTIAKVGYWDLDLVNNRLYWSEEIYRLLGLAPFSMDATFETFVEFVHPEDREWVTNAYLTHVSDKVEYDIIHRMLLKDGSIRYVNEKCETNYTEDGVPLRSLGIVIDITEQKKSEIELQKYKEQLENLVEQRTSELQKANERLYSINKELSIKEERYRLLAENVTEVIANFENSGKINYLSPSINNLLGYRTNELIGKNFIDFVENDFKLKFTVRLKVMKGKDSYLECPLIKKNGEKIWVGISLNSIKTEKNNVSFEYISVIRDITEIKKVQQSIVTSEENLREAQQLAKLGTWSLDILSNRMFWSEVQYSIYEVSRKEAPENFNEYLLFVHPDDMESIKQGYESIGKSKYIFESEYRIITKKGNMKYIFSRMEPVYQKGKLCSIKGINYDITRRKEAELELKKALDELNLNHSKLKQTQSQLLISEKMASLGTLTAGIAHEINNPMTFIHGGITALKESLGEIIPILKIVENIDENRFEETFHKLKTIKDEAHFPKRLGMLNKMVANIESGVDRTLEIVKGLQVFTRSREDEIISVDMHENLEATLIILRNSYKDIAHITKMFDTIPPIECNPGKINQVITNIIVNAIHALEEKFDEKNKGHIIIKTGFEQVNGIDSIGICIGNNGDRIPEKIRKKIFEPFFTTKPVGKGTGLGLSLSYTIVNGHKGTIKIVEEEHSIEGNNHIFTVFKITLPIVHV